MFNHVGKPPHLRLKIPLAQKPTCDFWLIMCTPSGCTIQFVSSVVLTKFKRTNILFYDYKEVAPFDLVNSIFCDELNSAVLMGVGLVGEGNLPTKWHTKV